MATTSPTTGRDPPPTMAHPRHSDPPRPPDPPVLRRVRGNSSTLARKAGKSSRRSSREPPEEMNQMTQVMMSWQYSHNPVRWFAGRLLLGRIGPVVRLGGGFGPAGLAVVVRTLQALGLRAPWSGVAVVVPRAVGSLGVWHFVAPFTKAGCVGSPLAAAARHSIRWLHGTWHTGTLTHRAVRCIIIIFVNPKPRAAPASDERVGTDAAGPGVAVSRTELASSPNTRAAYGGALRRLTAWLDGPAARRQEPGRVSGQPARGRPRAGDRRHRGRRRAARRPPCRQTSSRTAR